MKDIALVMGVHNALEYTKNTLDKVIFTTNSPVIITDDASGTDTEHYLLDITSKNSNFVYLRNSRQQLFTRTFNRCIRYAYHNIRPRPEFIICLNSDLHLQNGWLDWLIKGLNIPSVGIVGYGGGGNPEVEEYTEQKPPNYITGHCIGVNIQMLEEIGVFCESDTNGRDCPELAGLKGQAHIGSDKTLSWKANMHGWKTMYCNYPVCGHEAGKSWNHDLRWLATFNLNPLWEASDRLEEPVWY